MSHHTELYPPSRAATYYMPNRSQHNRNLRYSLVVQQQPQRARMCGFGDKDRRPVTPPPCVRLIVQDADTGEEVNNITDVDCNFYILTVDLWDEKGEHEVNLVMHPSNATAAPPTGPPPQGLYPPQGWHNSPHPESGYHHYQNGYPHHQSGYLSHGGGQGYNYGYHQPPPSNHHHGYPGMPPDEYASPPPPTGTFTRNLIGSLTASAFRLYDDRQVLGIWFVLQDLSIRTEGVFRLKFSFLNLGVPTMTEHDRRTPGVSLSTAKSKVICTAMSEPFKVYSAKKFPGMCESTELSKKFAEQGIRIPVRHSAEKNADGAKDTGQGDDDDDD